jgi:hypothetical protein
MGDGGIFVQGDDFSTLSGALVVRSKDEDKTQEVIPKLGRTLRRMVPGRDRAQALRRLGVDEGLTLRFAELPLPVHVASAGDRFVIA